MARSLVIDNYSISTPIIDILYNLQTRLTNGKLKDIIVKQDDILVTCPHHANGKEDKPACNIYIGSDEKIPLGYCRCFVCNFKGSFSKFVAECLECSEEYAKKWLISTFDVTLIHEKLDLGENIKLPQFSKNKTYIDESILKNYQDYCPYLQQRHITINTCKKYNIKYDPKYRQIIFPCYDESGHLLTLLKRAIDTKTFYIDKNLEKPLYGFDNIVRNNIKTCIITEGLFDRLIAEQYGAPTVAILGTPTESQIKKINKSCLSKVILMFDRDESGEKFCSFFHKHLTKRILVVDAKIPAPFKDIGELDYETFWKIVEKI